jgi:hypothetical protein
MRAATMKVGVSQKGHSLQKDNKCKITLRKRLSTV